MLFWIFIWFFLLFKSNFPVNATRECYSDGIWAPTTNYNDCLCNSTEDCADSGIQEETGALEISIVIYLVGKMENLKCYAIQNTHENNTPGYVLSFLALCGALAIFLSFRWFPSCYYKLNIQIILFYQRNEMLEAQDSYWTILCFWSVGIKLDIYKVFAR